MTDIGAMTDIGVIAAALLLLLLGGSWLVARAGWLMERGRHSHFYVTEYTRRAGCRGFKVTGSGYAAAIGSILGGAHRWLFAPGFAAVMITPWSIVSLHPIRNDR